MSGQWQVHKWKWKMFYIWTYAWNLHEYQARFHYVRTTPDKKINQMSHLFIIKFIHDSHLNHLFYFIFIFFYWANDWQPFNDFKLKSLVQLFLDDFQTHTFILKLLYYISSNVAVYIHISMCAYKSRYNIYVHMKLHTTDDHSYTHTYSVWL